jgi:S-adenosylmethionine-diacylglycerol 3-amino-3-carboxypropyl transferase
LQTGFLINCGFGTMSYFDTLNYSLGDEDSQVELGMLPERARHVLAIAGSGGRALPLLSRFPARLTCVDSSSDQLAMAELRLAALRRFERDDYMALLGFAVDDIGPRKRRALLAQLGLSPVVRATVEAWCARRNDGPIIFFGRFEQTLRTMSRVFRLIVGSALEQLFECATLEEQRTFVASSAFPQRRWNTALFVLGNASLLNAILYRGQFPKKNLPGSEFANYQRIFRQLLSQVYCRDSYFLQMLAFGQLRYPDRCCLEVDPQVYADMRKGAQSAEVAFVRGDVFDVASRAGAAFDFVSLSDVPSFLPPEQESVFLDYFRDCLAPGGTLVYRGHLRMADPAHAGFADTSAGFAALLARESTQLWQVRSFKRLPDPSARQPHLAA